ncbi:DinB family protein [Sinomicrobium weinanense]|uniref:DinB family protein n=1 Tax=Sinomicrobium weinanense TaxID=2842200 RepID=A0A926JQ05_9FLAO|nr:DinB family protein [Sinomicrobium weinanense]MBC9795198.1 DinB family protein [Sinomicrobium weinanense]MBU3121975.1 DinB family protein [Sinomicrobium weinanense]
MKSLFSELFSYNDDCNKRLIAAFRLAGDKVPEKSRRLFDHILTAHHIWNARLNGQAPKYRVWEELSPDILEELHEENQELSRKILEEKDFSEIIDYKNSKGVPFHNSIRNILFHVINHATYHRGQIAMDFRESGLEPLVTDYIYYRR